MTFTMEVIKVTKPQYYIIPCYSLKTISGWFNNSCMVIIHKMIEREMDNRGSKSNNTLGVKEQRVDGNCSFTQLLRCTLMDKVTCHQINPI